MPATGPNGSAVTPPWPKSKIGVSRRSGDLRMAHIIVFGNEKGGSGKTTAAIHVAVALARDSRQVGVIDLDVRQRSLSRHLENRMDWRERVGNKLPMPDLVSLGPDAALEAQPRRLRLAGDGRRAGLQCPFVVHHPFELREALKRLATKITEMAERN